MAQRRVLIVDDSKTAQIRLKKMLEHFEVEIDMVFSAEEALGYLSYKRPAAIFMDHHMEGMDGLEALKIIKSNPDTALIPVIMYTSEQGDVYVGQARALGALDILGKQVIQHANIEKVLSSLGIAAKGAAEDKGATAKKSEKPSPIKEPASVQSKSSSEETPHREYDEDPKPVEIGAESSLEQVQQQIGKLFELHIAKVRQEIEDSTKFLARRLAKESAEKSTPRAKQPEHQSGEPPHDLPIEPYLLAPPQEKSNMSALFLGIILISIAFVGYHIHINNRHQELLSTQYVELINRTKAQETLINRLFEKVSKIEPKNITSDENPFYTNPVLLDAMGWATNMNTQVAFGERALNDDRVYMLGDLLYLMKTAHFKGTIYLDVHLGDFCVAEDSNGNYILPDPASNIEDCVLLSVKTPEVSLDNQVSVGFYNFLNSSPVLMEGDINVDLSSEGFSSPKASYPPVTSAVSAGDWNEIAAKNNRISVSYSTD